MNSNLKNVFDTEDKTISYLIDKGVFKDNKKCPSCRSLTTICRSSMQYICIKRTCRRCVSIFKNSFFEEHKAPLNKILQVLYLYLTKTPTDGIIAWTGCSSATITTWTRKLRIFLAENYKKEEKPIGGPNVIVEVDETKLGKRKYNRGHYVEGVWCICGIEKNNSSNCFAVPVENRTSETIKAILKTKVLPGTIIYTDCWKAYIQPCKELNLQHFTVNHSKEFKNTITGVHTNTVEGFNNALKLGIKARNRTKTGIENHLGFFLWRRKNRNNYWNAFIIALSL